MRHRLVALFMWLVCATGPALAGDATVLDGESVANGLRSGSIFSSSDVIHLADHEHLVVYLQRGEMLTLEGPFDGPLPVEGGSSGDPDEVSMVSLLVGHRGTTSTVGAFESTPAGRAKADAQPNAWMIDVAEPGESCIAGPMHLFRADAGADETIVARNPLVAPVTLDWPAGSHTLTLPEELMSAGYVNVMRGEETQRYAVHQLPADRDVGDPGKLLRWFAEMGCRQQAAILIERMVE